MFDPPGPPPPRVGSSVQRTSAYRSDGPKLNLLPKTQSANSNANSSAQSTAKSVANSSFDPTSISLAGAGHFAYNAPPLVPVMLQTDFTLMQKEVAARRMGRRAAAKRTTAAAKPKRKAKRALELGSGSDSEGVEDEDEVFDGGFDGGENEDDDIFDLDTDVPNPSHPGWRYFINDSENDPTQEEEMSMFEQLGTPISPELQQAYRAHFTADPYFLGPGLTPNPRLVPDRMLDFKVCSPHKVAPQVQTQTHVSMHVHHSCRGAH